MYMLKNYISIIDLFVKGRVEMVIYFLLNIMLIVVFKSVYVSSSL